MTPADTLLTMASLSAGGVPVSLRSWPTKSDNGAAELRTLIQRVTAERGEFDQVTEESLRKEIAEDEATTAQDMELDTSDQEADDEDRAKGVQAAREQMIEQLNDAEQSAMYALEFISLLLTKDAPVQAGATMSQGLKDMVGTGTLGMDKLAKPKITDEQKQDDKSVAQGWKAQAFTKSVDSVLDAATRLEKEIERETKYWEEIMEISDKGWAVAHLLPTTEGPLGVRFGFSEASSVFKTHSMAALKRNDDGSISLDQSRFTEEPKTLRVRIRINNEETGSSPIPSPCAEDAPVEALILQARNTIFAAELWQEMIREGRGLVQFGVHMKGDTITFPVLDDKIAVLDLVSLHDYSTAPPKSDDKLAEGVNLGLHLLLSYAHRQTHRRRAHPPPPISGIKRPTPIHNLLRPVLSLLTHQKSVMTLNRSLRSLTTALSKASLFPQPTYTINPASPMPQRQLTNPERVIFNLTTNLALTASFTITPSTTINILVRTSHSPITTLFFPSLSPDSPLINTCPPPQTFSSIAQLLEYIYYATASALASTFSNLESEQEKWERTAYSSTLKRTSMSPALTKNLTFSIVPLPTSPIATKSFLPLPSTNGAKIQGRKGIRVRCTWKYTSSSISEFHSPAFPTSLDEETGLGGKGTQKKKERARDGEGVYEWVAWDDEAGKAADDDGFAEGEGEVVRSMVDVVRAAAKLDVKH